MSDERRLVSTNKGRGRAAVAGAEGSLYWVAILGYAGLLYCKSDYTWCYTASMLIQGNPVTRVSDGMGGRLNLIL